MSNSDNSDLEDGEIKDGSSFRGGMRGSGRGDRGDRGRGRG